MAEEVREQWVMKFDGSSTTQSGGVRVVLYHEEDKAMALSSVEGLFWLSQAGLPPVVLGPNILSKGIEAGPTTTQFGPTCSQTMSCLPGAHLRQAELLQMSCGKQI